MLACYKPLASAVWHVTGRRSCEETEETAHRPIGWFRLQSLEEVVVGGLLFGCSHLIGRLHGRWIHPSLPRIPHHFMGNLKRGNLFFIPSARRSHALWGASTVLTDWFCGSTRLRRRLCSQFRLCNLKFSLRCSEVISGCFFPSLFFKSRSCMKCLRAEAEPVAYVGCVSSLQW